MHGLAPMHICRRFIHRIADHPRLLHAGMHAQSCLTLCDPMDSSPPGSSVHGIPKQKYWSGMPFPIPTYTCYRTLKHLDALKEENLWVFCFKKWKIKTGWGELGWLMWEMMPQN